MQTMAAHKGKTTSPKAGIKIKGQGTQHLQHHEDGSSQNTMITASLAIAGPTVVALSNQSSSPKNIDMVDQVMAVNRSLVQQIDALRLRLQVDARHHNSTRSALEQESSEKLRQKDSHIEELKEELQHKEDAVKQLMDENYKKCSEIQSLQHTVNALKEDVEASNTYVDDIQHNLNILQEEKDKLQSGAAYKEKEELIRRLNQEVDELRRNLSRLERELAKAKQVISNQRSTLRLLDHEQHNIHIKFKDDLARATQTMRHEVEKIREVMRGQWEEMRLLRQQNEGMCTDIKEIKHLLLEEATTEHKGPMYNMGALKPSLPALSSQTRRNVPGKKKPLG